jgi:predicted nucleotidyltransferase
VIDERLFGKTRAGILREVYLNPEKRISFNELVRRVQTGDGAVSRELKNLLATGLVIEEREGNHRFLRAGRQSPLFPEIRAFIAKASGYTRVIRKALEGLEDRIDVAFVFGSLAKGVERPDSDLDLFVIGRAGYSLVTERLRSIEKRLGRKVQTLYFNPDAAVDRASLMKPSMQSLLSGPKRFVIGDDDGLKRVLLKRRQPIGKSQESR